jgi:DNA polymerase III subunit beta
MPSFVITKKLLQPKLAICNQVSLRKDPIEVYTHIKVEIKSGLLFLTALNSSVFYNTNIALASSTTDMTFALKTEMLAQAVDLIDGDDVNCEYDETKNSLVVKGKKAKHNIRTNPGVLAHFSQPVQNPEFRSCSFEIDSTELSKSIKASFIAVGDPKTTYQPEFCNVCMTTDSTDNSLIVVSTDRFRIIKQKPAVDKMEFNAENPNNKDQNNFLLAPKALKFLISALGDSESTTVYFEKDFAWFKFGSSEMILSYGSGTYPDYNRIIPANFACNFKLSPKELLYALRQVSLIGSLDAVNKRVKLKVDPTTSSINLIAENSDGEKSETSIGIKEYEGESEIWEQSFNSQFLSEYLSICETESILWESNPTKPSVLSPFSVDKNLKDYQLYLVSGLK